jgi:hypothetical protein
MKKDYSNDVELCRSNLELNELREFHSVDSDAPLVTKVLNVLANEEHMSTSRADAILTDAKTILPFISTI